MAAFLEAEVALQMPVHRQQVEVGVPLPAEHERQPCRYSGAKPGPAQSLFLIEHFDHLKLELMGMRCAPAGSNSNSNTGSMHKLSLCRSPLMADTLPAFAAIRVFEAAARLLSFTRAAAELGMTQAAVSYQIKLLEERLGTPLFLRQPRALALTEAGQWLAPRTSEAFEMLRDAFARFGEHEQSTLIVNTMHTFAAQWLSPRLGRFQLSYPKIAVRLETTQRLVDFTREEVDIVIRSGKGKWEGLSSLKLIDVHYTPMLSPALAEKVGGLRTAEDLLKVPLLDPMDPWWDQWFERHQLPKTAINRENAPTILMQTITASAAMSGMGAALLIPEFFELEMAAGRLIAPYETISEDGNAYWLAFPESRRNVPKIKAFRDWIAGEIGP